MIAIKIFEAFLNKAYKIYLNNTQIKNRYNK